jgi:hypothetical protein
VDLFGLFFLLIISAFLFVLPGEEEIDLLLFVLCLLGGPAIEGACFEGALDLHVVGLHQRPRDVDVLALLQTVLPLLQLDLAARRLSHLAGLALHLPVGASRLHPGWRNRYSSSFLRVASSCALINQNINAQTSLFI